MATQRFVAVGGGKLSVSPDIVSWVDRTGSIINPDRVVWSKQAARFVVLADGTSTHWSADADLWSAWFATTMVNRGLVWSPRWEQFVAVGQDAVNSSDLGVSWTNLPGVGTVFLVAVAATTSGDNTVADVVAVGYTSGTPVPRCFTGVRGGGGTVTWTSRSLPALSGLPTAITWSPIGGYVMVTDAGEIVTSAKGDSWAKNSFTTVPLAGVGVNNFGETVAVGGSTIVKALFPNLSWDTVTHGLSPVTFTGNPVWAGGPDLMLFPTSEGVVTTPNMVGFTHQRVGHQVFSVAWSEIDNLPPDPPTLVAPVGGASIAQDQVNRFRWTFNDPNFGDTQTGFELRWRPSGGSWAVFSGSTPNQYVDIAAGTFPLGICEYQVRTSDGQSFGDWSGSEFFTAVLQPGAPTIIAPIDNGTIGAGTFKVEWSAAGQELFQVRRVADDGSGDPDVSQVLWDSGEIVGSAKSLLVDFPTNNQWEHVQVRVRSAGLWTVWATVFVEVSYTPPAVPTISAAVFTVQTLEAGLRYTATNPPPSGGEPPVTAVEVWRRVKGDPGTGIRVAKNLAPNSFFDDWAVASGVEYEIRARAFGENGTATWSGWLQDTIGYLALPDGGFVELVGW